MSVLKIADFYYGAFLSALLNYAGKKPSLFDQSSSRRIYRLTTDNTPKDYMIYTKYVLARKNKSDEFDHWIFQFTEEEIQKLISMQKESQNVQLALICVKEGLKDSEIALVDYNMAMDCMGIGTGIKSYRINIKAVDNKQESTNIHFVVGNNHIVLPIDVDKEKFEYVVDQFMLATARCTPIEPTYTFYSEKDDAVLSKTETEIIQEEYEKQQKEKNQDE